MDWDDFKSLLAQISVFVFIVVIAITLVNIHESYKCSQYSHLSGRQTEWVLLDTCYIRADEEWVSKEEYTATVIAREGLKAN